jgi:hypothetical protein
MAARGVYRGAERVKVRGNASCPDPDEVAALAAAVEATGMPERLVVEAISTWITTRARLCAGARLTENLAFDLGDAKLRGFVIAALPSIGGALVDCLNGQLRHIPTTEPIHAMERGDMTDFLVFSLQAVREAAVAAGESPNFSMEIPF